MRRVLTLASFLFVAWTPLPQRLTPPLRLVTPAPIEGFGGYGHAASNGRGFFITSTGMSGSEGVQQWGIALDERGVQLGHESSYSGLGSGWQSVASDGENYLVVWYRRDNSEETGLYARRVDAEGKAIDRTPILLHRYRRDRYDGWYPLHTAAWNGSQYVVAFQVAPDLHAVAFVGRDGVLAPGLISVVGFDVAANREGVSLIAGDRPAVDEVLQPIEVQRLGGPVVTLNPGSDPVLAAGGNGEFLIVYRDDSGDIQAQRLDSSAQPIAPPVRVLGGASLPMATWVNDHWIVVATRHRGTRNTVQAIRVDSNGAGTPITLAEDAGGAIVASNGTQVLVSWSRIGFGRQKAILEGTTVSAVGPLNRLLGPGMFARVEMIAVGDATLIAVNAGGVNTDVWSVRDGVPQRIGTYPGRIEEFTPNEEGHALLALTNEWFVIDLDGTILGRTPSPALHERLRAVALGPDYLVMWIRFSGWRFGVEYDIHGITVAADGSTRTPRILASSAIAMPAAAAAGEQSLVVWPEPCPGCYAGEVLGPGTRATPFARRTNLQTYSYPESQMNAVAPGDGGFLFTTIESIDHLHVRQVSTDGTLGRATVLRADNFSGRVWLGWTGEYYLLLAQGLRSEHESGRLYAMRFERDGKPIDLDLRPFLPFAHAPIHDLFIRDTGEIELVTRIEGEPFTAPQLVWTKLTSSRRRAVR